MFKSVNKVCMIHRPVPYEFTSVFTHTLLQRKSSGDIPSST